jgi:hypothetical protein
MLSKRLPMTTWKQNCVSILEGFSTWHSRVLPPLASRRLFKKLLPARHEDMIDTISSCSISDLRLPYNKAHLHSRGVFRRCWLKV